MQEIRRDHPAAAAAGAGELGAIELIPPQDRRLPRAAVCFLALGFCILIHTTTVPNHHTAASRELVFVGFFVFIVGAAALALFTLGGAGAGRADARLE